MLKDQYVGQQTPFICLKARLSQAWMQPALAVLVLYILKLVFLQQFLDLSLNTILLFTLDTCAAFESNLSTALSAPRQAAIMANALVKQSTNSAVHAIFALCDLLILALKELILFMIEITCGTWTCLTFSLFNIAANTSLDMATASVHAINDTVVGAANDLASFVEDIENLVNGATGLINEVSSFVSGEKDLIGKVNVSLDALRNIQIPSNVTASIDNIKKDIPTYDDAQKAVSEVISIPFELLRNEVGLARNGSQFMFNENAFDVPPQRSVSVCDPTRITADFLRVKHDVATIIKVFTALCAVSIFFVILWRSWSEYRRWARLDQMADNIDTVVGRTEKLQSAANMSAISFATMTSFESVLSTLALRTGHSTTLTLWLIQYACNKNAMTILSAGLMGIIITILEYAVLCQFRRSSRQLKQVLLAPVTNATNQAAMDLVLWRQGVNLQVQNVSTSINKQVLGWVHSGSMTVNSTLSSFMSEINKEINKTLGNTPLYKPVQAVVDCVIGNKVERVEKGLTWVHQHSQVTLPSVRPINTTAIIQTPGSVQMVIQNKIDDISDSLLSQIKTQAIISCSFLAAWLLVALVGALYVLHESRRKELPPWSAHSEKTFEELRSPAKARATRFFEGPRRNFRSQAKIVEDPFAG